MTQQHLDRVEWYLRKIKTEKDDPEAAHGTEDEMYREVLGWIANGKVSAQMAVEVACLALTSSNIEFPRWSA